MHCVLDSVRQKDGFFYYKVEDDTYINTCVQHKAAWADQCDSSIGVCAGNGATGDNYGFSSQQATALMDALGQVSNVHPNCPYGCETLGESWREEISAAAPSISEDEISAVTISLRFKFYCVCSNSWLVNRSILKMQRNCQNHNDSWVFWHIFWKW